MDTLETDESAPLPRGEDEKNMKVAVEKVHKLVEGELSKGIDPKRIVLAGFSQGERFVRTHTSSRRLIVGHDNTGCAITLLAGLSATKELGGLMCLSGWLPLTDNLHKDVNGTMHPMQSPHANKMPVFWGHGTADPIIRYGWGEKSRDLLKEMGFSEIESHAYPGEHRSTNDLQRLF